MDLEQLDGEKVESEEMMKESITGAESVSVETSVQEKKDENLQKLADAPDNSSTQLSKKENSFLSSTENEVPGKEKLEIKYIRFSSQNSAPPKKTFESLHQKEKLAEGEENLTSEQTIEVDSDENFFLNLANESLVEDLDEDAAVNSSKTNSANADVAETKENFEAMEF